MPQIPTHIITGFLGSGKTTALNNLLTQKPDNERWAIIVNEFGKIGIDQTAIPTSDDVQIKEIAGGCVCCALGPALTINLAMMIRRTKPDRILIEPTGLGHPAGLVDIIQGESFKEVLELRSIICLLDPRAVDDPRTFKHETFIDQLNLADYVVINKTDLATEDQINEAYSLTVKMYPPKAGIEKTTQGKVSISLLDSPHHSDLTAQFPNSHDTASNRATPDNIFFPSQHKPIRLVGQSNGAYSCGWVFHAEDIFDFDLASHFFSTLNNIWRAKGVLRIGDARIFYNSVNGEMSVSPIAWRRDSRIEVISHTEMDWDDIEKKLLKTLKKVP